MRRKTWKRLLGVEIAVAAILGVVMVDAAALDRKLSQPGEPIGFAAPAPMVWAAEAPPEEETWENLGTFKLTFYCPCRKCSGKWGHQTASGAKCTEGRTVAVDRRVIPLGTEIRIGGHVYVAEDTGVRGRTIDIFMEDHGACLDNGVQYSEIYIKKPKEGKEK